MVDSVESSFQHFYWSRSPHYHALPMLFSSHTPAPLPNTVIDFWRLVWQEKCPSIVMLTNLVEGGKVKCLQYWPDSDSKSYGPFEVTITDKQMFADYLIRVFTVKVSTVPKWTLQDMELLFCFVRCIPYTCMHGKNSQWCATNSTCIHSCLAVQMLLWKWHSSTSLPGLTMEYQTMLLQSWPSTGEWNLSMTPQKDLFWFTAGKNFL